MRAVVQRVSRASVVVEQEVVSSVGRGLCVLVGLCREDGDDDIEYIVRKLLNLRLFEHPEKQKRWDASVKELGLDILCVSQFTLHACIKGNKLDFHRSMGPEKAPLIYEQFLQRLRNNYEPERVKDGKFGAMMSVQIENDGPVTINLDSKRRDE
ncbi:hypothetical protein niasHT_016770 [Heterodera trifolii]|uniref:D-aminoacyl-tRNA deacylase n=1 Tax=Heterodera trifolii TaxID=157864 RepID=A0ABD2LC96_9BILA